MFVRFPSIMYLDKAESIRGIVNGIDSWVVTEKIDGSNFQLVINMNDGSFEVGKRSQIIENEKQDVVDLWRHKDRFVEIVDQLYQYFLTSFFTSDGTNKPPVQYIIVYGEFFGPKIMQRIDYGANRDWRLFAIGYVNHEQYYALSFKTLVDTLNEIGQSERLVPILGYTDSAEHGCQFPNDMQSRLTASDSVMEGIVVCPYDVGCNIRFKVKNEKYAEKDNNKRHQHYLATIDGTTERLHLAFKEYCTENRMYSVFSKFGRCVDKKETSKYLAEFIRDAIEEFTSDYPEFGEISDKSIIKKITNVGGIPYQLFTKVNDQLK